MMHQYKINIGIDGRFVLPAKVRQHFGISNGDQVMLEVGEELKIIPIRNVVQQFQALVEARNINKISLVEKLIESRSKEFGNE